MKSDGENPLLGQSATTLGVRLGIDIRPDNVGMVKTGTGGMSVSPSLATIPLRLLPRRLHNSGVRPGAIGSNSVSVWKMGDGGFTHSLLTERLVMRPDPVDPTRHGFVEPDATMTFEDYAEAVELTRNQWTVDES